MRARQIFTIVDKLDKLAKGRDSVAFGEIVDLLGTRGFGPLLLVLSVLLILPIGLIPGVGGVIGLIMLMIGVQMLRGQTGLWLPQTIRRRELPSQRVRAACARLRRPMHWLRRRLKPRLTILTEGVLSVLAIGTLMVCGGLAMMVFGVIPIIAPVIGIPVLFFALGLTARDGAAVALGYLCVLPPVILTVIW